MYRFASSSARCRFLPFLNDCGAVFVSEPTEPAAVRSDSLWLTFISREMCACVQHTQAISGVQCARQAGVLRDELWGVCADVTALVRRPSGLEVRRGREVVVRAAGHLKVDMRVFVDNLVRRDDLDRLHRGDLWDQRAAALAQRVVVRPHHLGGGAGGCVVA
jgi:hypothetical protein